MNRAKCIAYSISDGWRGIFHNLMMSLISYSMLVGSLLVVGSLVMLVLNIDSIIEGVGDRNEILIYVSEDATDPELETVASAAARITHVESCVFVSRESALESMKEELSDYPSILEGMEEDNPLRDSFRIRVDDPENAEAVAKALSGIPKVEKVQARADVIESFLKTRSAVNLISIGLMVLLGVISFFIIMNTIRISAYTRREEIGIMRMVGAEKSMIRLSFVTEAVIITLAGSLTAYFLTMLLYNELLAKTLENTGLLSVVPFADNAFAMLAAFVAVSLVIGIAGSLFSINRYLRV